MEVWWQKLNSKGVFLRCMVNDFGCMQVLQIYYF